MASLAASDSSARLILGCQLLDLADQSCVSQPELREMISPFARLRGGGPGEADGIARSIFVAVYNAGPRPQPVGASARSAQIRSLHPREDTGPVLPTTISLESLERLLKTPPPPDSQERHVVGELLRWSDR